MKVSFKFIRIVQSLMISSVPLLLYSFMVAPSYTSILIQAYLMILCLVVLIIIILEPASFAILMTANAKYAFRLYKNKEEERNKIV